MLEIGQVYYVNLRGDGCEQRGARPCLVFQNNAGNKFSPNVVVLPLTSVIKRTKQPTHVVLKKDDVGLKYDSVVLCENPVCISKDKIGTYITTLPYSYMQKVAIAYMIASSAISFVPDNLLGALKKQATKINAINEVPHV